MLIRVGFSPLVLFLTNSILVITVAGKLAHRLLSQVDVLTILILASDPESPATLCNESTQNKI